MALPVTDPGERSAPTPREVLLAQLTAGMHAAVAAGDLDAARVAHRAIGELLGTMEPLPGTSTASTSTPARIDLDHGTGARLRRRGTVPEGPGRVHGACKRS
jgi:hypothetical protein